MSFVSPRLKGRGALYIDRHLVPVTAATLLRTPLLAANGAAYVFIPHESIKTAIKL